MNIFFYINVLAGGGAERVVANLANSFSKLGNQVSVVTSYKVENEYITDDDVERYVLEDSKEESGFIKRNLRRIHKLRNLLKENKPDLLISFMAEPNFRSIIACRGLKPKIILSVRNDPNREYSNHLTRFLAKHLYKKADGIVFQTEDSQKWFPKQIQEKSRIIYNQVAEDFYRVNYDLERHDIVTTGRLVPQKNHELLIRAYAAISDQVKDNLIIYGEGILRPQLEKLVKELHLEERVFLPGSVKDVANTIKSAKLFVLSSDYEGMPNALMEAMALGLPCISTDCPCGGPKAIIQNNDYLVSVGNKDEFAKKILFNLQNNNELQENGLYMRQQAKMFYPTEIFAEWEEYINQIIVRN